MRRELRLATLVRSVMSPWKRTLWVVFAANLVTAVGMMSFLPFFPSYLEVLGLRDRDEIAAWTGLVFGAAPLAAAFMGPIWGSIGDRFGRKAMVLRAMCAIMLFVGAMGLVRSPLELLLLRIGQGIFSGFVPPSITLVSVAAPRDVQGRVAGSLQTALAAGSVVGPLLGAFIQAHFGLRAVFFCVAVAAGLSAIAIGMFTVEDPELRMTLERWSPTSVLRGVGTDFVDLFRKPRMREALLVLFCVQFGLGASNPLMELYVRDLWTGRPERVPELTALLFTCLALATVLATPAWGRHGDRVGFSRALRRSALSGGLVVLLHAVVPFYAALLGVRILLGATASGANASAFGVAAVETEIERRGSAFGVVFSARAFAVSLGAISGGALASVLGIPGLFLAAGLLILGVSLLGCRPGREGASGL